VPPSSCVFAGEPVAPALIACSGSIRLAMNLPEVRILVTLSIKGPDIHSKKCEMPRP
jgi:hypothetical protein